MSCSHMKKNCRHRAQIEFFLRLCMIKCPRRSSYQTEKNNNYALYILCRPSYQGLVFDEQSSTHGTDMRCVRVHRQNCGTATYGQPKTDGIEEYTHRI